MTGRHRTVAGGILLAAGLVVLGWLAWSLFRPPPAPYSYELVDQGPAREFPDLGLEEWPDIPLRTYELRGPDVAESYAVLRTSVDGRGKPVLLSWQSRVAEPVITQTAPLDDLLTLARAIGEHTPPDALLLAWWDTSRQLALLTGRETLLREHLAEPVIVPVAWHGHRAAITSLERDFWQPADQDAQTRRFREFTDALLQDARDGAAALARLAGRGPAYLVLHSGDAYKLGILRPAALGIGYRDFHGGGQVHGLIQRAKQWLQSEGYRSYTVDASGNVSARVYYLTDPSAESSLAVQALSFTTSNPLALEALKPVYQHGGYWVYEVPMSGEPGRQSWTADATTADDD